MFENTNRKNKYEKSILKSSKDKYCQHFNMFFVFLLFKKECTYFLCYSNIFVNINHPIDVPFLLKYFLF